VTGIRDVQASERDPTSFALYAHSLRLRADGSFTAARTGRSGGVRINRE
jgi:hypothetical protein